MNLRQLRVELTQVLQGAGLEDPVFETRRLVQEGLSMTLEQVLLYESTLDLSPSQVQRLRDWCARRAQGEPLAYLTGRPGPRPNSW
jgi:methylase of polypeptide subunit release factors